MLFHLCKYVHMCKKMQKNVNSGYLWGLGCLISYLLIYL